ncbi:MAG: hypothetical protein ACRC9U_02035 [Metamycoplasmataceae bacterium]
MSKRFVVNSYIISGFINLLSVTAIITVIVLIQIRNGNIQSKNLRINPHSGINNASQADIDEMTSTTNSTIKRSAALSKLFKGVDEKNVLNFIAEESSDSSIILNAKEDYFFNQENIKSLSATYKIVEVINITAKPGIINISQADIDVMISIENPAFNRVLALSKLFDGVTEENINNITIEKTSDEEITLHANEGFAFGSDTVSSLKVNIKISTVLNISAKQGIINITSADIVSMISVPNTPEKIAALSKLFDGIDNINIINVRAEKTSEKLITLRATDNYTFGSTGMSAITVNINIVSILDIRVRPVIDNISEEDIQTMISTTKPIIERIVALSKLFDGINQTNIINFSVEKSSSTEITLKANQGYAFGSDALSSLTASVKVSLILNITAKQGINNITNADIVAMISVQNTPGKITALSKIFDGIDSTNVANIKAVKTTDTVITLNANEGYSFISPTITSITSNINIVSILNIKAKSVIDKVTEADIAAMLSTTNSPGERVTALSKLFDGVDQRNLVNFKVEKTSATIIVLNANPGYAFGETLVNSVGADINKVVEILNIKAKIGTINLFQADIDAMTSTSNSPKDRVAALLKLFDGVTEENLNNFKIVKNPSSITLNANDGFALGFITTTSITTNFKIITILNISPKVGINNITESDIFAMISLSNIDQRIAALSKVFDGITKDNVANVKAEKTSDTVITLIANDGYYFGSTGINSIRSNIKIVLFLNISPKTGIIEVLESDVITMTSTANSLKDRAAALSKVFNNVNESNIIHVRAERTSNSLITLRANGDYLFEHNSSSTTTANIQIVTILNITTKSGVINILESDITEMTSTTNSTANRIAALSKLFNGITESNISNISAEKTSNTIITLKTNKGFSFGSIGINSLKADIKIITLLNISPKTGPNNVTQADINIMTSTSSLATERAAALSKLFNNITPENTLNFKVSQPSNEEITLTANDGYAFNSITTTSITAAFRIITLLNINPKEGNINFSDAHFNTSIPLNKKTKK